MGAPCRLVKVSGPVKLCFTKPAQRWFPLAQVLLTASCTVKDRTGIFTNMPSSYHGFLPQPMPLTPPYTDGSYPQGNMQYSSTSLAQAYMPPRGSYGPASDMVKQYTSRYPFGSYHPPFYSEYDNRSTSNYCGSVSNAKAPMLPPIQTLDHSVTEYPQMQKQPTKAAAPPKEDKPVGGVCPTLTYEMEQMVDFVSESTQGMYALYQSRIYLPDIDVVRSVNPNVSVAPAFRKYVSQVLTSTRLPSSTILYGLHYLSYRMTELSKIGVYLDGSGDIYRLLTTALILGSKFADDNTFQNRSWSEVSNIPVADLNRMELDWLKSIKWDLHIDLDHPDQFRLWEAKWKSYEAKKIELSMASLKLSPLHPNIQRQPSMNKRVSPKLPYLQTYYEPNYGATHKDRQPSQWPTTYNEPNYENWPAPAKTQYSPPSAPHTGPNTPEWYGRGWYGTDYRSYGSSEATTPASAQSFQSFAQQASYQKPYPQQYAQSKWGGHNSTCGCAYCVPTIHDPFYASYQHRSQPVAG